MRAGRRLTLVASPQAMGAAQPTELVVASNWTNRPCYLGRRRGFALGLLCQHPLEGLLRALLSPVREHSK